VKLNQLPKTTDKNPKRIGRGFGSGKGGHTSSRGAKGAKSKGRITLTFEGTKFKKSLFKRLPLMRGKGKLKSGQKPLAINLKYLSVLPKDSVVDLALLVKHNIVSEKEAKIAGIKILGDGDLKIPLTVKLPCSKGAAVKIKKAGGKILA